MTSSPRPGSSRPTTSAASTAPRWTRRPPTRSAAPSRGFSAACATRPPAELAGRGRPRHAPDRAGDGGGPARGTDRRGRARARRGHGRHRDALPPGRLARPRRRRDGDRLAQPEGLHRRQARPRGGAGPLRRRRHRRRPARDRGRPRRRARGRLGRGGRHLGRVPRATLLGFIDPATVRPLQRRRRRRQRDGRADGRPDPARARPRPGRDVLRARRRVPRPRAEPAAGGEPAADHRAGAAERAPTSGSPGTATPTAASSSTARATFCDGDFVCALLARSALAKEPGATILYDPRSSRAVPDTVAAAGGRSDLSRVGHAFFKRGCARRARSSAARSPATTTSATSGAPTRGTIPALLMLELLSGDGRSLAEPDGRVPLPLLHLRRDQLRGRRSRGEDGGDRPSATATARSPASTGSRSTTPTGTSTSAPRTPSRCCA